MQIILSGRGVALTPSFRALVERKIGKLAKILPQILGARMVCSTEKFRRKVRLTLTAKRRTFAAVATAADMLTAIDLAITALARQVRQEKDRRRAHKLRTPQLPEPSGAVPERLTAKPMSVDAATDDDVLYRRRGGRLGLIEPVA